MYSEWLLRLAHSGDHAGTVDRETHRGVGGEPGCGPYLVLSLRVAGDLVQEARYQTYGCPVMRACGEVVCVRSEGEPLAQLQQVTPEELRRWVGGVPEGKEHCLELAATALAQVAAPA